jgi:hypothetical protein
MPILSGKRKDQGPSGKKERHLFPHIKGNIPPLKLAKEA